MVDPAAAAVAVAQTLTYQFRCFVFCWLVLAAARHVDSKSNLVSPMVGA
jgi:hypothetical protein